MRIRRMGLILAIVIISAFNGSAKDYGGVDFPNGDISFADRVVSYMPAQGVQDIHANPSSALGPPDYDSRGPTGHVSLGNGAKVCEGELILEFTDNALVDVEGYDLWIFEVGPAVEATDVYISEDGRNWISLGVVKGSTRGVDISNYTSPGQKFHFVKLCDHPDGRSSSYPTGGPDIDAVGAIGTIPVEPIIESTTPPLMYPTPEQMSEWVSLYESAPAAAGTVSAEPDKQPEIDTYARKYEGDSFSLLEYLQYDPDERSQGS